MTHYKRVTNISDPNYSSTSKKVIRAITELRPNRVPHRYLSYNLVNHDSIFKFAGEGNIGGLHSLVDDFGTDILNNPDADSATCLHHAASNGQLEVIRYLIESKVDLNAVDKDGNTALHIATKKHHQRTVHILLENAINDVLLNANGLAGLHIAAASNNIALLDAYLHHSYIDIGVEGTRKTTALHIIAESDNLEACKTFHSATLSQANFRRRGLLTAVDEDARTPIHMAAHKGSHKVLDFLLTKCQLHGHSMQLLLELVDRESYTPLHAAIAKGELKTVKVLLQHGAKPDISGGSLMSPFFLACSQGRLDLVQAILTDSQMRKLITFHDRKGETCLHHCAHALKTQDVIIFLLNKGADVNSVDNRGRTPLIIAVITGNTKLVVLLLEKNSDITIKDSEGNSALHYAVTTKRLEILESLLKLPAADELVTSGNNYGQTPFHRALRLGITPMVNIMVSTITHKTGNVQDLNGNNYLHNAAYSGDWKAINSLLEIPECFLQLNETNKAGETPLHIAAGCGHLDCVDIFISHGAVIHKCNKGFTPFLIACLKGHVEVARSLFTARPIQIEWTNDDGDNALHMGAKCGSPEILTLCLDIGVPVIHNNNLESFFDMIVMKADLKCAAAVIRHNRYQEALDLVSPFHDHPMLNLIAYMPSVAKEVLDHSYKKSNLPFWHPNYRETFDFKYISLTHEDKSHEVVESTKRDIQLTLKELKGRSNESLPLKRASSLSHLRALAIMVKFNRKRLLTHPISDTFLKVKWKRYGKWIHILLMLFVFLQVFFLMLFTVSIPRPASILKAMSKVNFTEPCSDTNRVGAECFKFSLASNIFRFITIGLALLNSAIWLLSVVKIRGQALNLVNNAYILIDLLSLIFTTYYLIPIRGLNNAYWRAGAVAVFFSWFSLLLRIQLFEVFGLYITMFLSITRRVIQVLMICFLFLISFSVSLYILVGGLDQYSNVGYSLFLVFAHFLGELNFLSFIREDLSGNLEFDWLTYLFVIVLAVLLSIVIVNMLVGLAVGDIELIESEAIAEKKQIEVSFFTLFDSIIPAKLLSKLNVTSYSRQPNKKVAFWRKYWRISWRFLKGRRSSRENAGGQKREQWVKLAEHIESLSLQQEKMMEKLNHMEIVQEKTMKLIADLKDNH